jgi:hypothetical protein
MIKRVFIIINKLATELILTLFPAFSSFKTKSYCIIHDFFCHATNLETFGVEDITVSVEQNKNKHTLYNYNATLLSIYKEDSYPFLPVSYKYTVLFYDEQRKKFVQIRQIFLKYNNQIYYID